MCPGVLCVCVCVGVCICLMGCVSDCCDVYSSMYLCGLASYCGCSCAQIYTCRSHWSYAQTSDVIHWFGRWLRAGLMTRHYLGLAVCLVYGVWIHERVYDYMSVSSPSILWVCYVVSVSVSAIIEFTQC